jgi:hypothetical protein
MVRKKTQAEVYDIFKNGNCELIDEYKNSMTKMKFKCSCGEISEISLNSFNAGCRCINCREKRLNETNMNKYGVAYVSQRPETKESTLAGIKKYIEDKKHTIESIRKIMDESECKLLSTEYIDSTQKLQVIFKCGCNGEISYNKFDKGHRCSNNNCMNIKKEDTSNNKFNVPYYTQTDEYKSRVKETNLIKYGFEHHLQNPEILEESIKNCFKTKIYTFPSGKTENYQGYENLALDKLITIFNEDDIIKKPTLMPEIWYSKDDGKYHRYIPDIYIPSKNIIYEIKSIYTLNLHKKETDYKRKAVESLGYNFNLLLYNDKKVLITEMKF